MLKFLKRNKYPRRAIWRNKDFDKEVVVTGVLGKMNGETFYAVKNSLTGIPSSQIIWLK